MTLVEVLASIVLLSTTLTVVLVAWGRHAQQLGFAARKHEALILADGLLDQWFAEGAIPTQSVAGAFAENPDYQWRTRLVGLTGTGRWTAAVLEVDVLWIEWPNRPLVSLQLAIEPPEDS